MSAPFRKGSSRPERFFGRLAALGLGAGLSTAALAQTAAQPAPTAPAAAPAASPPADAPGANAAETKAASEAFLKAEGLASTRVTEAIPVEPEAAFWAKVDESEVLAYPQRSVKLWDKAANEKLASHRPLRLRVKVAYSDRELGLRLEWADQAPNRFDGVETGAFADSAAVQFPVNFGENTRLPHIGMGDEQQWVRLYLVRAAEKAPPPTPSGSPAGKPTAGAPRVGEFVAAGFGSRTRVSAPTGRMSMSFDAAAGTWRATLVRPLEVAGHSLKVGLVPVAFAVFQGSENERGGNKALSGWRFLRLSSFPTSERFVAQRAWGYGSGEQGDPAQGKPLVEAVCVACHHVGDKRLVPAGLAPALTGMGGYLSREYLRQSILDPSAVVVTELNMNAHYDRNAPPDKHGAYPNQAAFAWSTRDAQGKRVSKMPPFQFPPEQVANMVAYLKTLDGAAGDALQAPKPTTPSQPPSRAGGPARKGPKEPRSR